jgi:pSer/pThr/pTyr-binding forkhead associated (FHA) protein
LNGIDNGSKEFSIGRGKENDIVILDKCVSRSHATLSI